MAQYLSPLISTTHLNHPLSLLKSSSLRKRQRMAPLPSSEQVGRRLYELLEQPQEPFVMQVYLLQNGCSGRIIRSHSSPSCWPLNAAGRRLRKLGSHGGIRRSRAAGFLRRALVKLVYSKAVRKVLHLNMKRSSFFDFFSVESKEDQLSPVSVLELQHSDKSSPFDKPNEYPLLPSIIDSPREISITLKESKAKSLSPKKAKFSNRRELLFECLREAEERIWSFHGCLDSDLFEEAMNELSPSWERRKGDSTREEWNQFKPEVREIGLFLEASILDDLKEEAILDMFNPNYH